MSDKLIILGLDLGLNLGGWDQIDQWTILLMDCTLNNKGKGIFGIIPSNFDLIINFETGDIQIKTKENTLEFTIANIICNRNK